MALNGMAAIDPLLRSLDVFQKSRTADGCLMLGMLMADNVEVQALL